MVNNFSLLLFTRFFSWSRAFLFVSVSGLASYIIWILFLSIRWIFPLTILISSWTLFCHRSSLIIIRTFVPIFSDAIFSFLYLTVLWSITRFGNWIFLLFFNVILCIFLSNQVFDVFLFRFWWPITLSRIPSLSIISTIFFWLITFIAIIIRWIASFLSFLLF